jgi:hypothetical protein
VVLALGAPLQQVPAGRINQEGGHGAVKVTGPVRGQLLLTPYLTIVLVYQDHLVGHGISARWVEYRRHELASHAEVLSG